MAYKFRLEQILKYRMGLEDRAQEELARRNLAMEKISRNLEGLNRERDDAHGLWRSQTEKEIDIASLNCTYHYLSHLGDKIVTGTVEQKKSIKKVDEQRHVLKECWQDRRIMEILQDKKHEEYRKWEDKQERNINDELSLTSFVRNRRMENGG